ncbi:hypothetical protein PAGU2595_022320 [Lysobacter xanthus]
MDLARARDRADDVGRELFGLLEEFGGDCVHSFVRGMGASAGHPACVRAGGAWTHGVLRSFPTAVSTASGSKGLSQPGQPVPPLPPAFQHDGPAGATGRGVRRSPGRFDSLRRPSSTRAVTALRAPAAASVIATLATGDAMRHGLGTSTRTTTTTSWRMRLRVIPD